MYNAGDNVQSSTSLGMHPTCVYAVKDGKCIDSASLQVENTPAVVYSLGDKRILQ